MGDAWIRGWIEVFEEHAYTELLQTVLRLAIAAVPLGTEADRPHVLLTSFPNEPHGLGLLLAEALLRLEGCLCVSLGAQTPVWDIVRAATAYRSDIVALSFTGCMKPNQVVGGPTELSSELPPRVRVWARCGHGAAPTQCRGGVAAGQPR